jgi:septum formation protein
MNEAQAPALILASASEARLRLMRDVGIRVDAMPAHIDESAIKQSMIAAGAAPQDIAIELSALKAQRISAKNPGSLVIGADQILVFEGQIFDKPRDRDEAFDHLSALSGKTHRLISAAVLVRDTHILWRDFAIADLTMRRLEPDFIATYLDRYSDDCLKSVGAYKIESTGAQLFASVSGDPFTIQGIPMFALLGQLRELGFVPS